MTRGEGFSMTTNRMGEQLAKPRTDLKVCPYEVPLEQNSRGSLQASRNGTRQNRDREVTQP